MQTLRASEGSGRPRRAGGRSAVSGLSISTHMSMIRWIAWRTMASGSALCPAWLSPNCSDSVRMKLRRSRRTRPLQITCSARPCYRGHGGVTIHLGRKGAGLRNRLRRTVTLPAGLPKPWRLLLGPSTRHRVAAHAADSASASPQVPLRADAGRHDERPRASGRQIRVDIRIVVAPCIHQGCEGKAKAAYRFIGSTWGSRSRQRAEAAHHQWSTIALMLEHL
jgi:hypothetical protein